MKSGEYFGDLEFFSGMSRILNYRCLEFTVLLKIKRDDFLNMVRANS